MVLRRASLPQEPEVVLQGNRVGDAQHRPHLRLCHLEIGKGEILREGDGEVAILAYGSMVYPSMQAAENLSKDGVQATVVNARFVKPLDADLILASAEKHGLIVTVEEAYLAGGFGSAVMELLEANDVQDKVKVVRMGVADEIVTHGDPKGLLSKYGLNPDGIATRVSTTLTEMNEGKVNKRRLKAVK